ncbi:MAG: hypothetical protein ACYCPF_10515 [Streptosporangiaceae bacterium]
MTTLLSVAQASLEAAAQKSYHYVPPSQGIPGSIGDFEPPFSSQSILTSNSWWNVRGGVMYRVWAGVVGVPGRGYTSQGVIVVEIGPKADPKGSESYTIRTFRTPRREGMVRIVRVTGMILTVETRSGSTLTFNVGTLRYE